MTIRDKTVVLVGLLFLAVIGTGAQYTMNNLHNPGPAMSLTGGMVSVLACVLAMILDSANRRTWRTVVWIALSGFLGSAMCTYFGNQVPLMTVNLVVTAAVLFMCLYKYKYR